MPDSRCPRPSCGTIFLLHIASLKTTLQMHLVQVLLCGLHVEVASHSCGSMSVIVCSDALDIWDATKESKLSGNDTKEPAVICIGQQQAAQGSSSSPFQRSSPLHLRRSSKSSLHSRKVYSTGISTHPLQCQLYLAKLRLILLMSQGANIGCSCTKASRVFQRCAMPTIHLALITWTLAAGGRHSSTYQAEEAIICDVDGSCVTG